MERIYTEIEVKSDARISLIGNDENNWSIGHDELWKRVRKHMRLVDRFSIRKKISAALTYVEMGQDLIDGNKEDLPADPDNWMFVFK